MHQFQHKTNYQKKQKKSKKTKNKTRKQQLRSKFNIVFQWNISQMITKSIPIRMRLIKSCALKRCILLPQVIPINFFCLANNKNTGNLEFKFLKINLQKSLVLLVNKYRFKLQKVIWQFSSIPFLFMRFLGHENGYRLNTFHRTVIGQINIEASKPNLQILNKFTQ